jgi:hypothetical protein
MKWRNSHGVRQDATDWHRAYAWLPTRLNSGDTVWFEYYERRWQWSRFAMWATGWWERRPVTA